MNIIIFYIDIRAPDKGNEEYYRKAREMGVMMIRGKVGNIREDPKTNMLKLNAASSLTGDILEIDVDLVVLSTGMVPSKGTEKVSEVLGLGKDQYGFLTEIHGCLKPQETVNNGIYICGCASGPKNIPYSVSTASAAASKAAILLSHTTMKQELLIAEVSEEICMGCHRCEKLCNYEAIKVNEEGIAKVIELKCKGCGVCVASCPARAIELKYYRNIQIIEEIKGICHFEKETIEEIQPSEIYIPLEEFIKNTPHL